MTKYSIYPGSDKYRFLIKHGTGLGKTVEALSIAENFTSKGKKVFILTFNPSIFINDMLKFPELGFITFTTKERLDTSKGDELDYVLKYAKKEALKNVTIYGYKEFENILFWTEGENMKYNVEVLSQLNDSIIICDEIHDVYNSEEENTWGKTIEALSNIMQSNMYMVYMSATPLNNPEEIDDIINLMVLDRKEVLPFKEIKDIADEIMFKSIDDVKLPVSIMTDEETNFYITKYMKNRISFVPESQEQMPRVIFQGIEYEALPNVSIIPCFHGDEFRNYYKESANYLHDEEWKKHICFNFPEEIRLEEFIADYKRKEPAIIEWSRENGVEIEMKDNREWITGQFLRQHIIGKYSPKFEKLLELIIEAEGKSFIYINNVKNVGVDMIASLLKSNGIIHEKDIPSQDTICFACRERFKDHNTSLKESTEEQAEEHKFIPYKFITITGRSKSDNDKNMKMYNDPINITGTNVQIVIGSKIIKQGFNVLSTNNTFVLSMPYNVPNLLEVLGRNARTKSHAGLPEDKEYVNINILVTAGELNNTLTDKDFNDLLMNEQTSKFYTKITREELEYYNKFSRFRQIEKYEQLMHEVAIDPEIYGKLYFRSQMENDDLVFKLETDLKMLPFKPEQEFGSMSEFSMDNYYKEHLHRDLFHFLDLLVGVKFRKQNTWNIDDLVEAIQETNTVPNPQKINPSDIYFAILNHENVSTVGDYVIKTEEIIDLDWFMPEEKESEMKRINLSQKKEKQINASKISKYIEEHFPEYCSNIDRMKCTPIQLKKTLSREICNVLCDMIFETIPRMEYTEFESIMIDAFDKKDVNMMRLLFLMNPYVCKSSIFSVPDDEKYDIIGFESNNRKTINIREEEGWEKTKAHKDFVEYGGVIGILSRNSIRLIENNKSIKKEEDKRYEFEGIVCETMSKEDVDIIAEILGIKKEGEKTKTCELIKEKTIMAELTARLQFENNKTIFFDFT